jgi:hypothetical protein
MNVKLALLSLIQRADCYLALLIITISSTLIIVNQLFLHKSIILELSITLLCISSIYLLIRKKNSGVPDEMLIDVSLNNIKKINILFFTLIILANYCFYSNLYRPEIYFIIIVFCCALIAFDILYTKNNFYSFWVLFKIFIIAFVLRAQLFYEYPGYYGVDPWTHMLWVQLLQEFGNISMVNGLNVYPPVFHIEVLMSMVITNLNLKDSLFFSLGFMYCIAIFFVFLFARSMTGLKIGLLSSLFIAINQFHIGWGAWLVPSSIGVLIFSVLLYLITSKLDQTTGDIIIIILSLELIYLHTLSPIVILIAVFVYLIAYYLLSRILPFILDLKENFKNGTPLNYKIGFFLVVILSISVASRFTYNLYTTKWTFLEATLIPFLSKIKSVGGISGFNEGDIASFTPSDFPLNRIGFYLIVAFIIFGALYWLKPKVQSREKIGLIFTIIALIIFSYGPALFQINNFIPGRWIVFAMILAAPICAFGIYQMSTIPRTKYFKLTAFILIIATFSFFAINSNSVNIHTPFYGKVSEDPSRDSLTDSEIKAADTLLTISDSSIDWGTDEYYGLAIKYYEMEKFGGIAAMNPQNYNLNENKILIIREYFVNHNGNIESHDLNTQGNLIYNNNEVRALFKKNNYTHPNINTA